MTYTAAGIQLEKDDLLIEYCGELDELNCHLGATRTLAEACGLSTEAERLALLQNEIFDLGAEASLLSRTAEMPPVALNFEQIRRLEEWIDGYTAGLPALNSFVLPGGNALNAALHITRAVCRRVERRAITLHKHIPLPQTSLVYLNRLSDLLFAMARASAQSLHAPEVLWKPKNKVTPA